jgi:16S rRNA processing protein RimM
LKLADGFELGFLERTHGFKGEVVLQLDVDNPSHYKKLGSVYLFKKGKLIPFFVSSSKLMGKDELLLKFEDIDDETSARDLLGSSVHLPAEALPPLRDDQYYYHELRGMQVIDDTLGPVGMVLDVYETPQQHLLAFEHQGKEVLCPLNDTLVYKVDKKAGSIHTRLPEGLIDVYLA